MIIEGDEMPNGWPLGLGNLNSRIRVAEAVSQPPPPPQPHAGRPLILRSVSFSSFSSSNLDTESTASFFPDRSVSLGRLIGIRPANKKATRSLYDELHIPNASSSSSDDSYGLQLGGDRNQENPQGICVPLLYHVIGKMNRSGSSSSSSSSISRH